MAPVGAAAPLADDFDFAAPVDELASPDDDAAAAAPRRGRFLTGSSLRHTVSTANQGPGAAAGLHPLGHGTRHRSARALQQLQSSTGRPALRRIIIPHPAARGLMCRSVVRQRAASGGPGAPRGTPRNRHEPHRDAQLDARRLHGHPGARPDAGQARAGCTGQTASVCALVDPVHLTIAQAHARTWSRKRQKVGQMLLNRWVPDRDQEEPAEKQRWHRRNLGDDDAESVRRRPARLSRSPDAPDDTPRSPMLDNDNAAGDDDADNDDWHASPDDGAVVDTEAASNG